MHRSTTILVHSSTCLISREMLSVPLRVGDSAAEVLSRRVRLATSFVIFCRFGDRSATIVVHGSVAVVMKCYPFLSRRVIVLLKCSAVVSDSRQVLLRCAISATMWTTEFFSFSWRSKLFSFESYSLAIRNRSLVFFCVS